MNDTVKRLDDGRIRGTVDRGGLAVAQTPQAFRFGLIADAHRRKKSPQLRDGLFLPEVIWPSAVGGPRVSRRQSLAVLHDTSGRADVNVLRSACRPAAHKLPGVRADPNG